MEKETRLKNLLTAGMLLLLLLSGIFLLRGYLNGNFDSAESLRDYLNTFGPLSPIVLTGIQALQVVLPVLPGFLGCIVGAGLFGAAGGFWCNYIGISAGSILAFLLARRFGVGLVRKLVPADKYDRCAAWVQGKKSYTVVLALAILLPLAPDDFLCYFSGLTGMSAQRFVSIVLLAKPWCILAYSLFFGCILAPELS